jgi:hypothetical protein
MEQITLSLENKTIILTYSPFDTDIDLDDITSIHYENLFGEMVTVSTLLNKIGLLKADVEAQVKDHDFELAILKAERMEYYRKELTREQAYVRKEGSKTIEPGSTEVENAVYLDPAYKIMRKKNIRLHRDKEYVESLYWSIKSKDDKLSALMKGVTPVEFQSGIIMGTINTIMIKDHKNVLPTKPKIN